MLKVEWSPPFPFTTKKSFFQCGKVPDPTQKPCVGTHQNSDLSLMNLQGQ